MKSSRSRSRPKSSRNRNSGNGTNVINRVFDSSGPEGKVRGTPQQIIDKYTQLARDSQLSGDRVATENFQQHAEHYLRLLSEAQREQEARREEHERQNRERQLDRDRAERQEKEMDTPEDPAPAHSSPSKPAADEQPDLIDSENKSTLVEIPEDQPKPRQRRPRKPRTPAAKPSSSGQQSETSGAADDTPVADASGSADLIITDSPSAVAQ